MTMKIQVSLLVGLCAALQSHGAWAQSARFLSCEIPAQLGSTGTATATPTGPRIFRAAPKTLQEWSARDHEFGRNLCETSTCSHDAKGFEGSIMTASVVYRVGVDQTTGKGYWRAKGASNLPKTEGECDLVADPSHTAAK